MSFFLMKALDCGVCDMASRPGVGTSEVNACDRDGGIVPESWHCDVLRECIKRRLSSAWTPGSKVQMQRLYP
jgi:hypothetical protein